MKYGVRSMVGAGVLWARIESTRTPSFILHTPVRGGGK